MNPKYSTQKAFLLFECILAILLISIIALFAHQALLSQTSRAAYLLVQSLHYTKMLALTQSTHYTNKEQTQWLTDKFPSINPQSLIDEPTFWQLQFHQSGTYTKSSFSIYLDTPRISSTTHYDGRPMAGDLIAIEGINLRCLSGYNNTNISDFCKNNADSGVRFLESFGINLSVKIQDTCKENQTAQIPGSRPEPFRGPCDPGFRLAHGAGCVPKKDLSARKHLIIPHFYPDCKGF